MEKLLLKKYIDYIPTLNLIDGQVTSDGTLILIESNVEELDFFERPVPKNNWTIKILKDGNMEEIQLRNVPLIPTEVDVFSDGTILIVQGRCLKDGTYVEKNARRYDRDGNFITEFTLGDGIEQMQIDETDTIWVSYFDEGIFGNFGWDEPIGSGGVVAFTAEGERLWDANEFGIVDCYAMNVVSSNKIYFFYIDDFYLVHLNDKKESIRYRVNNRDYTLQQFMFDQNGLIGQSDTYTMIRYKKHIRSYTPKEEIQLISESGKRLNGPIFMRGNYLYIVSKEGIYQYYGS